MENFDFSVLCKILKSGGTVLVAGHENPDGDCMGSMSAIADIFNSCGWDVVFYSSDKIPYNFRFLNYPGKWISSPPVNEPDLFIVVDCGEPVRMGSELMNFIKKSQINSFLFDHHKEYSDRNRYFYTQSFCDPKASASAVIIYRFIKECGFKMTSSLAKSLYAAIMSDTGGLRYSNTDRETFSIMSDLVSFVDPWQMASHMWENVPEKQIRLLGEVLTDMDIIAEGRAAAMEIKKEQLDKYGLSSDHIDKFVNYARSIEGVELAMRFREMEPDFYKVSMRSRGNIDASLIAHDMGGGGHKNAAGFIFRGSYEAGLRLTEKIINEKLKKIRA
ncbi:MAG: bifunctional oligoribonuclease/PAP phosphatase NrnA [bacterium]